MGELKDFVIEFFESLIKEVERKNIGIYVNELSIYEKVLIYKYTLDKFEELNNQLREGQSTKYEIFLNQALSNLPDYKGLVFRGANLTKNQIRKYEDFLDKETIVTELGFLSTSKSRTIADMYSKGNVLFRIISKKGKLVENLAFFGSTGSQNEQEVLFKSKTNFLILGIQKQEFKTLITLEEIQNDTD